MLCLYYAWKYSVRCCTLYVYTLVEGRNHLKNPCNCLIHSIPVIPLLFVVLLVLLFLKQSGMSYLVDTKIFAPDRCRLCDNGLPPPVNNSKVCYVNETDPVTGKAITTEINFLLVPYFRPRRVWPKEILFLYLRGSLSSTGLGVKAATNSYFKPSLTLHLQSFYHCILEWYGEHCTTVDEIVCWEGISYLSVCAYMFLSLSLSLSLSTLALKPFILVSYLPIGDCKRTLKRKTRYTKIVPQRR